MHRGRTLDLVLECMGRCKSHVQRKKKHKLVPQIWSQHKGLPFLSELPSSVLNSDQRNWDFFLRRKVLELFSQWKDAFPNFISQNFWTTRNQTPKPSRFKYLEELLPSVYLTVPVSDVTLSHSWFSTQASIPCLSAVSTSSSAWN